MPFALKVATGSGLKILSSLNARADEIIE